MRVPGLDPSFNTKSCGLQQVDLRLGFFMCEMQKNGDA